MSLKTLKPRLLSIDTRKVPTLEAKAGTTVRMRGEKWTKIRRKMLAEGGFTCVDCGRVSASNQIDHEVPLEQGGSYDRENLKIRCVECHAAKTANEQRARYGRQGLK